MIGRRTLLILFSIAAAISSAHAQVNCSSGSSASGKLACLIPGALASAAGDTVPGPTASSSNQNFHQFQNSFNFLTADLGGELSQIPLASPASGVIFVIDPTLKVPVPSDQSLGPILTQRADTIGRHKLYVATTYQYFLLKDVDGGSLLSLPPTAFFLNSPSSTGAPDTLSVANGRVDLKIHQFVGYVTFGLTDFADVSVAVPVLRVQMRYTFSESVYNQNGTIVGAFQGTKPGEATGIGDVVLAYKERVWKGKHTGLSFGAEVRLPTGDAENFLGSGTFGIKPFVTFTRSGKISPHFNLGYQFNGNTKLVTDSNGHETRLPDRLLYSAGADWGIAKRLTIAADILEQRVVDSPRATTETTVLSPFPKPSQITFSGLLASQNSSYNRTDGSIGLKLKPFGNVLVTGNLLVKLDRNGLRERYAPLVGVSFTY